MNSDILKGKWNQIKGDVKKSFGKLTDDDMLVIEGDATKATAFCKSAMATVAKRPRRSGTNSRVALAVLLRH